MTLVKVERPKPVLGELFVPHRPWVIYDRFHAREQTVLESEVAPEWFIWMGNHFAFFALAEWNGTTKIWWLQHKTHWRTWEDASKTIDLGLHVNWRST